MNALHWYDKTYDLWRPWLLPMGHGFMAHSRDHTSSETVEPLIPSGAPCRQLAPAFLTTDRLVPRDSYHVLIMHRNWWWLDQAMNGRLSVWPC